MPKSQTLLRNFGQVYDNPVLLDNNVTAPICEGFNIVLASFQALYLQYQKHHFVVEGAEFYMLHQYFADSYAEVQEHIHEIGERLDGLGGVPVASLTKLAQLCCFEQEQDGVYSCRQMVSHDLVAEQAMINLIRRQATQAESLGERATRHLYETILLKTEERAYHLGHFLAHDSLTLGFVVAANGKAN